MKKKLVLTYAFALIAVFELYSYVKLSRGKTDETITVSFASAAQEKASRKIQEDQASLLGWANVPNGIIKHKVSLNGKILFDAKYTMDPLGRRNTFVPAMAKEQSKYLIFLGCSYTFGWGVEDDETVASIIGKEMPELLSYNYGTNAYGPNQVLARLKNYDLRKEVAGTKGVAIYTWIDSHLERLLGVPVTQDITLSQRVPVYSLDSENRVIQRKPEKRLQEGTLSQFLLLVEKLKNLSFFFSYLQSLPSSTNRTPSNAILAAKILGEIASEIRHKFNNDEFWLLLLPPDDYPRNYTRKEIVPRLDKKIRVIDYGDLFDGADNERLRFVGDWHPNSLAYRKIAQRLMQELRR